MVTRAYGKTLQVFTNVNVLVCKDDNLLHRFVSWACVGCVISAHNLASGGCTQWLPSLAWTGEKYDFHFPEQSWDWYWNLCWCSAVLYSPLHVKSKLTFLLPKNYIYDIIYPQYYARRSLEFSIWHSVHIWINFQSGEKKTNHPVNTLWYSCPAACYRGKQIHPCYKSKPFVFSFCFPFSFLPLLYDQYGLSLGNIIRAVTATSNVIIHRVAGNIRTSRIN